MVIRVDCGGALRLCRLSRFCRGPCVGLVEGLACGLSLGGCCLGALHATELLLELNLLPCQVRVYGAATSGHQNDKKQV